MASLAWAGCPPVQAVQQRRSGAAPAAQPQQSAVQHAVRLQPRPLRRRGGLVLASAEAAAAPQQSAQPPAAQQQEQQQQAAASQPSVGVHGAQVTVENMVKHFQTRRGVFKAVNGVDVTMEPGTITALLGPSGSGALLLPHAAAACVCCQLVCGHLFLDMWRGTTQLLCTESLWPAVARYAGTARICRCALPVRPRCPLHRRQPAFQPAAALLPLPPARPQARRRCCG